MLVRLEAMFGPGWNFVVVDEQPVEEEVYEDAQESQWDLGWQGEGVVWQEPDNYWQECMEWQEGPEQAYEEEESYEEQQWEQSAHWTASAQWSGQAQWNDQTQWNEGMTWEEPYPSPGFVTIWALSQPDTAVVYPDVSSGMLREEMKRVNAQMSNCTTNGSLSAPMLMLCALTQNSSTSSGDAQDAEVPKPTRSPPSWVGHTTEFHPSAWEDHTSEWNELFGWGAGWQWHWETAAWSRWTPESIWESTAQSSSSSSGTFKGCWELGHGMSPVKTEVKVKVESPPKKGIKVKTEKTEELQPGTPKVKKHPRLKRPRRVIHHRF